MLSPYTRPRAYHHRPPISLCTHATPFTAHRISLGSHAFDPDSPPYHPAPILAESSPPCARAGFPSAARCIVGVKRRAACGMVTGLGARVRARFFEMVQPGMAIAGGWV